jgi:hypothetical protein
MRKIKRKRKVGLVRQRRKNSKLEVRNKQGGSLDEFGKR